MFVLRCNHTAVGSIVHCIFCHSGGENNLNLWSGHRLYSRWLTLNSLHFLAGWRRSHWPQRSRVLLTLCPSSPPIQSPVQSYPPFIHLEQGLSNFCSSDYTPSSIEHCISIVLKSISDFWVFKAGDMASRLCRVSCMLACWGELSLWSMHFLVRWKG